MGEVIIMVECSRRSSELGLYHDLANLPTFQSLLPFKK